MVKFVSWLSSEKKKKLATEIFTLIYNQSVELNRMEEAGCRNLKWSWLLAWSIALGQLMWASSTCWWVLLPPPWWRLCLLRRQKTWEQKQRHGHFLPDVYKWANLHRKLSCSLFSLVTILLGMMGVESSVFLCLGFFFFSYLFIFFYVGFFFFFWNSIVIFVKEDLCWGLFAICRMPGVSLSSHSN